MEKEHDDALRLIKDPVVDISDVNELEDALSVLMDADVVVKEDNEEFNDVRVVIAAVVVDSDVMFIFCQEAVVPWTNANVDTDALSVEIDTMVATQYNNDDEAIEAR
jgi:hypothetical protein